MTLAHAVLDALTANVVEGKQNRKTGALEKRAPAVPGRTLRSVAERRSSTTLPAASKNSSNFGNRKLMDLVSVRVHTLNKDMAAIKKEEGI
jgi:hypothetical protein